MKTQKGVFLNSEGDAWFKRNRKSVDTFDNGMRLERATDALFRLPLETGSQTKILEIGCGRGFACRRGSKWYFQLWELRKLECHGRRGREGSGSTEKGQSRKRESGHASFGRSARMARMLNRRAATRHREGDSFAF